jgi:hypothetical protein
MFNRGVPAFYNQRLNSSSREERFLLKRRIRLMEKLRLIEKSKSLPWYAHNKRRTERLLRETEAKLGIKP